PCQPRRLQGEYHADLTGTDLGQQFPETLVMPGAGARTSLVLVDGLDRLLQPTQRRGTLDEGILASRTLAVAADLMGAGLTNVDDCLRSERVRANLGMRCCLAHDCTSGAEHGRKPSALRTRNEKQ